MHQADAIECLISTGNMHQATIERLLLALALWAKRNAIELLLSALLHIMYTVTVPGFNFFDQHHMCYCSGIEFRLSCNRPRPLKDGWTDGTWEAANFLKLVF